MNSLTVNSFVSLILLSAVITTGSAQQYCSDCAYCNQCNTCASVQCQQIGVPVPFIVTQKQLVEVPRPYPVGVRVPQPYLVTQKQVVEVPRPYPVMHAVPVAVPKHVPIPYAVHVPQPYPVHVPVEKPVPYPVHVQQPVYIDRPVQVDRYVPLKQLVQVPVAVPVPVKSAPDCVAPPCNIPRVGCLSTNCGNNLIGFGCNGCSQGIFGNAITG